MMLSRSDLHDYQHRAADFIVKHDAVFGILGLGLGKTVSTLTATKDLLDGLMVNRVLVIAPLRVGLNVWPQEVKKWRHLSGLEVAVAIGAPKQREKALDRKADITIINRENVLWLVQRYGKDWPFDMAIVDESTSFKSSSSKRFKALKKIRHFIRRMVLLTATPAPNSLLELWPQAYLLDMGESLGKTFSGYRSAYFESDYMGYNWTIREGAEKRIQESLKPYTLTMRTEDYLSLPEKIERVVPIPLDLAVLKKYREFEREFLAEIEGEEITAVNAAVLCGKLQQAAQGAIYGETGYRFFHDAKLDALEDLIESAGEPVLVAYGYKHDFERIKERFPHSADVRAPGIIDKWNAGKVPLLCCHPASAGHGLNLQHGGHILIWFCQSWSGELTEQLEGRLYRQGQTKPTMIFRLIAEDTIDERIHSALGDKSLTQKKLIESMIQK